MNLIELIGTEEATDYHQWDWRQAFIAAGLSLSKVVDVLAASEGQNEGADWIAILKLTGGKFCYLAAGCDYTGWDSGCGGHYQVRGTLEDLIASTIPVDERHRLGIVVAFGRAVLNPRAAQ
jgi:hypothetical protein